MAKQKTKIIGPLSIEIEGLKKLGKSCLLTIAGIAIGFGLDVINMIDYGSASTVAATLLPLIANTVRKFAGKYEIVVPKKK